MGQLLVITVPPDARSDQYTVILGDCVLPGHVLGRYPDSESADVECRRYAEHYGLTGYPIDTPWKRRSEFALIQGGKRDVP